MQLNLVAYDNTLNKLAADTRRQRADNIIFLPGGQGFCVRLCLSASVERAK